MNEEVILPEPGEPTPNWTPEKQVGFLVTEIQDEIKSLMVSLRELRQVEPQMLSGTLTNLSHNLEQVGMEIAARWRYHEDTGGW